MATTDNYSNTKNILLEIAGILTFIPLAPFINRFIPPVVIADFNIDLLVSMLISFLIIRLILWLFKPLIVPALILIASLFLYNMFTHGYSFADVLQDYKSVVKNNWGTKDSKQIDALTVNPAVFQNYGNKTARGILGKINPTDSVVRNFSVQRSLDHFDEYFHKYGSSARYLSLFKYINNNFKYVSDAKRDEYFASPRETIFNGLGGDCDDHSILMMSCLESIGARCRIVLVAGHAYPELYCGSRKDFESMQSAIIQCFKDLKIREFHYHENEGEYWINLDYTAQRPGGPYMNDNVYAFIED
ncbi:MAG: transglutaminase domain-containing protein [Chitinophagaceae bacterium]|nr:transglutaminase domain-containing protein [Chitinophagaceae bacterium]